MASPRLMLLLCLTGLMFACGVVEYMVAMHVHNSQTLNGRTRPWSLTLEENGVWQRLSYVVAQSKIAGGRDQSKSAFLEHEESFLSRLSKRPDWVEYLRAKNSMEDNSGRVRVLEQRMEQDDEEGKISEELLAQYGPEVLVENDKNLHMRRPTLKESRGNHIMLTLRTMKKYHSKRLPLLFSTWLTKVNRSNVFVVTDEKDPTWQRRVWKNDMHYVVSSCKNHESREDRLCCRTGTELAQIFKKGYEHYDWLCHIDDDMYVLVPPLVQLLSPFNGRRDAVYLGRSGSSWFSPRKVLEESRIGTAGQKYHFAVGGMYCLSRAMLEMARPYIVGARNLTRACAKTQEPDDVTIGLIIGVALNKSLTRTEKIYTHGLHLVSTVDPDTLNEQVAFSYGFGSTHWGYDDYNAIYVPNALYSLEDDDSQFKSLHCHLYPQEPHCVTRSNLIEAFNSDLFSL